MPILNDSRWTNWTTNACYASVFRCCATSSPPNGSPLKITSRPTHFFASQFFMTALQTNSAKVLGFYGPHYRRIALPIGIIKESAAITAIDLALEKVKRAASSYLVISALRNTILNGFPNDKCNLPMALRPF